MKVAIIEDHKIIAETLSNSLKKQAIIKEVRHFYSSTSFLDINQKWQPHLIISDLLMPGITPTELVKAYKNKLGEEIKIIILSSVTNLNTVNQIIHQGANGYLSKEESLEELIKAIHKVINGEKYISESLREENQLTNEDCYHLSPREKDVLNLVCSGRIMKEIADDLGLSIHTVQSYHKNILRKFKVRRTTDLIVSAIREGFYHP